MAKRKIGKREQARIDAEREARLVAFEAFRDKYHGKVFQAKVRWFDNMRGEGSVRIDDELSLPIYACNIKGRKTWFAETACVFYKPGQLVDIEIDVVNYSAVFAKGLTLGHFDTEGWDRIKDQNLAFRCNDEGEVITGLFA